LGVPPSLELFRKLFRYKPQPSENRIEVFGGAEFQLRDSGSYLEYNLPDSHGEWKRRWFYIENHPPALPVVTGHTPKKLDYWVTEPEPSKEVDDLLSQIEVLKVIGLSGVNVAASFLKRRVQPLQMRDRKGFEYLGFDDPS